MNRLKQLRESKGMTRVELAELMDVTKLTILNWELGTNEIKGSNARKLADRVSREYRSGGGLGRNKTSVKHYLYKAYALGL